MLAGLKNGGGGGGMYSPLGPLGGAMPNGGGHWPLKPLGGVMPKGGGGGGMNSPLGPLGGAMPKGGGGGGMLPGKTLPMSSWTNLIPCSMLDGSKSMTISSGLVCLMGAGTALNS